MAKGREKENDSSVYLKITNSDYYDSFRVRACGWTAASSTTWINLTYVPNVGTVSYVTCSKNVSYEIHNMIYEYGFAYANLGFHSTGGSRDYISGVWSPDCAGNYTDAVQ